MKPLSFARPVSYCVTAAFLLLGLHKPAQAGSWQVERYVWSGAAHLKGLSFDHPYDDPAGNAYDTLIQTTNAQEQLGQVLSYFTQSQHPQYAQVAWIKGSVPPTGSGDEVIEYEGKPAKSATAFARSSVHAILKWHRDPLLDPVTHQPAGDDPNDNPPKTLYVSETVDLEGWKTLIAPFLLVSGQAGRQDLKVSLDEDRWQPAPPATQDGYYDRERITKIH